LNYLLDTNIVIFFFKGKQSVLEKIREVGIQNCFISEITLAELSFGQQTVQIPKRIIQLLIR